MTKFNELKAEHQHLLTKHDASGDEAALIEAVQKYIDRVRIEAEQVADPRDRDQLRSYLRFWGAYLFDQTGAYPDTSLRPSIVVPEMVKKPESTRKSFFSNPWIWILGTFLLIALCAIIFFVFSNQRSMASQTPRPTIPTQSANIEPTQAPATPISSPSDTPTPSPSDTPDSTTATVSALLTQASESTLETPRNTSTPTATQDFYIPVTGGGGEFIRPMLVADVKGVDAVEWCTSRNLEIGFRNPQIVFEQNTPLTLRIDPIGAQRTFSQEISMKEPVVRTDLAAFQASDTYALLHLEHPGQTSTDVIFRYSPDCPTEQLQVVYQVDEEYSYLEEEPPRSANLALVWNFVTWGPAPDNIGFQNGRWFALLELSAQGGDGTYLYWKLDDTGSLVLSDTNQVLVYGYACVSASTVVATTSDGQTITREIVVKAPYCR